MPVKHKLPQWEREDNRTKVFLTLFEKSYTFTDLLKKTGFYRSTLTQHLKDLQKDNVIERAVENGKVVYRTIFDEKKLFSEMKKSSFELFLEVLRKGGYYNVADMIEKFMIIVVKGKILSKRLEAEKKSPERIQKEVEHLVVSEASPSLLELLKFVLKHNVEERSLSEVADDKEIQSRILSFLMGSYGWEIE